MADFLTKLAGRTIGLAPIVQPAIVPMYAPTQQPVTPTYTQELPLHEQGTTVVDGATSGFQNTQAAYSHVEPFQPVQPRPESMPPHLVPPADQPSLPLPTVLQAVPDVQTAPATRFVVGQEERQVNVHLITPNKPQRAPLPGHALRPTRQDYSMTSNTPESASSPVQSPRSALRIQSSTPLTLHAPSPSSSLLPASRGENQSKELSLEEASLSQEVDTITSETPPLSLYTQTSADSAETAARAAFPRYRSRAEQLAMGQREETTESSSSRPTIQVTIGRIEVRATPPPTTHSQRQRPGPPVMGLEEYLTQRAKGGN